MRALAITIVITISINPINDTNVGIVTVILSISIATNIVSTITVIATVIVNIFDYCVRLEVLCLELWILNCFII